MSEIFREIDEELRRDNLLKLWTRYGKYIVLLLVLVALGVAGFFAWREHRASEARAQATLYGAALALAKEGKNAEAATLFGTIGREQGGYARLAPFEQAELLAKTGDLKGSVAIYDQIAAAPQNGPVMQDLATLLSASRALSTAEPAAMIATLRPLTEAGKPFRPSALELTALAKLRSGDRNGALDTYKTLADELSAPAGQRARAAEMVRALSS